MRKINKKISLFLAVLTLISICSTSISTSAEYIEDPYAKYIADTYLDTSSDYINGLVLKLNKFVPSKDVCIDFLYQEILLHRALLFATYEIQQFTKNPELMNLTEEIADYYSGEIRELRQSLPEVIKTLKEQNIKNDDTEYMKDYKNVIAKMENDLSPVKNITNDDEAYITQSIAILQAMKALADNSLKYSKITLTKELSESLANNTPNYISQLKELQNKIK